MEDKKYQEKELFISVFQFFKKNLILLLVATLIGGVLGFAFSKMGKRSYTYSSLVCSEIIEGGLMAESMAALSYSVESRDFTTISKVLNLPVKDCKSILNVTFDYSEDLAKRKLDKDMQTFGDNCIQLKVLLLDSSSMQTVIDAVHYYVKNYPTFKRIQNTVVESNKGLLEELKLKTTELNVLQKKIVEEPEGMELNDLGYDANLHMLREINFLNLKIARSSDVAFFTNNGSIVIKNGKKTMKFALAGGFAFLFLTISLLLIREMNKLL